MMEQTLIWNNDNRDNTYSNPILYTDYSDPDAIRVGEDYYMIASSFCNVPGLPLLHSKDLVNWEIINYILNKIPGERYDKPVHGCGVWAPSIRYHEGIYYACFPMPDEGIYMSTTKDPYGKWSEPINIRPGAGWIDPCPFWDEDGKAYLVAGVAKSRIGYKSVLHIVEMAPDGNSLIGDEVKIFDGNENDQVTIEGPKLYKRNGYYYIFAPAGGVKIGWQTVLRSRNIFGPYEYKVVMRQGDSDVNGPHQGAWIDTVSGEDWFLHFQDVYAAGRIIHLQPMSWQNDWPIIGIAKDDKDYGEPVKSFRKPNVGGIDQPILAPPASDDFAAGRLNLSWQWNANPKADWIEFCKEGLILHAVFKNCVYGDTPNLLLQKWPAPEFECTTIMDLSQLTVGDEAGVISMGMSYGVLSFVREENGYAVKTVLGQQKFGPILVEHTNEEMQTLDQIPDSATRIHIKYLVVRDGLRDLSATEKGFPKERVTISYSTNGNDYVEALSMTSIPGRWVGVKNGVFCLSSNPDSEGNVLVHSVIYNRL